MSYDGVILSQNLLASELFISYSVCLQQEMLQLIHGPKGFISCMEQVLNVYTAMIYYVREHVYL